MTTASTFPSEWSRRLVSTLVASGELKKDDGDECLKVAHEERRSVAEILARVGLLEAADLLSRMAQLSGLSAVDIYRDRPMGEAFKAVPHDVARSLKAIGYRLDGNVLTLASVEPLSAVQLRELSGTLGRDVVGTVLADPVGIERVMDAVYPRLAQVEPPVEEVSAVAGRSMAAASAVASGNGAAMAAAGVGGAGVGVGVGAAVTTIAARADGASGGAASAPGTAAMARGSASMPGQPATPPGFRPVRGDARGFAEVAGGKTDLDVDDLLTYTIEHGASDLHLTAGIPPSIRVDGAVRPIEGIGKLSSEQIRGMVFSILPQGLRERFEEERELDTSHSVHGVGRFRVNVYLQRGQVGAALRAIPHEIPAFGQLGLPDVVEGLAQLRRGLVLITGPTGSGKSTTLASLLNIINRTKPLHIVTIEDPIEFLHTHERAIVNQREVGSDTASFSSALRRVLRQDPDVILVGELRDTETISTALTAAETGHLVFATLHTQDAPQTIDRIIDVFPSSQQDQVRIQVAGSLQAVVTQQLVVRASGIGRIPIAEVMMVTPAIQNLIRSAKTHQIYSLMQTGGAVGMQTMDQALARAVRAGKITEAMAFDRCHNPAELGDHLKLDA
jgi:twitching motility protein PilT